MPKSNLISEQSSLRSMVTFFLIQLIYDSKNGRQRVTMTILPPCFSGFADMCKLLVKKRSNILVARNRGNESLVKMHLISIISLQKLEWEEKILKAQNNSS